ncbi:uncharacterized protein LOC123293705 [Chrysoperla carnea]|uniref:uncharacterized protein LOC123293705 n=1 Tax=Chrysoperla carnea TaxID=189513 RepID=UPI001D088FCD|nr:uncharacterized protein LOC123293705 [Chrysoperla carnea]
MEKPLPKKRVATKGDKSFKQSKPIRRSARLKNNLYLCSKFNNNNKNLLNPELHLTSQVSKQETEPLQQGCHTSIQQLPNEILLHIFKFLSTSDLWFNVQFVCRQWEELSKCHSLWETIDADGDVPTNVLQEWLKIAPSLKTLKLRRRKDADIVIEQASKLNRQLVTIEARDCWGSSFRRNVKSKPLCNLLRRCPMLSNINFEGTRFISCKFYKLMAKHTPLHSSLIKRRKSLKTQNTKVNPINYSGCANGRQIKAFLLARNSKTNHQSASVLFEGLCQRQSWQLSDDYEVVRHAINLNYHMPAVPPCEFRDVHRMCEIGHDHVHLLEPLLDENEMDLEERQEVLLENIDQMLEYIGL